VKIECALCEQIIVENNALIYLNFSGQSLKSGCQFFLFIYFGSVLSRRDSRSRCSIRYYCHDGCDLSWRLWYVMLFLSWRSYYVMALSMFLLVMGFKVYYTVLPSTMSNVHRSKSSISSTQDSVVSWRIHFCLFYDFLRVSILNTSVINSSFFVKSLLLWIFSISRWNHL